MRFRKSLPVAFAVLLALTANSGPAQASEHESEPKPRGFAQDEVLSGSLQLSDVKTPATLPTGSTTVQNSAILTNAATNTWSCYYLANHWSWKKSAEGTFGFIPSDFWHHTFQEEGELRETSYAVGNNKSSWWWGQTGTEVAPKGPGFISARVTWDWEYRGEYYALSEYSPTTLIGGTSMSEVTSRFSIDLRKNGLGNRTVISKKSLRADSAVPLKSVSQDSGTNRRKVSVSGGDRLKSIMRMRGDLSVNAPAFTNARGYMDFYNNNTGNPWWVSAGAWQKWDFTIEDGRTLDCDT